MDSEHGVSDVHLPLVFREGTLTVVYTAPLLKERLTSYRKGLITEPDTWEHPWTIQQSVGTFIFLKISR